MISYVEFKIKNQKSKLIDTKNRVAARAGGGGWEKWVKGVNNNKQLKKILKEQSPESFSQKQKRLLGAAKLTFLSQIIQEWGLGLFNQLLKGFL